jgi:hypothetical protein
MKRLSALVSGILLSVALVACAQEPAPSVPVAPTPPPVASPAADAGPPAPQPIWELECADLISPERAQELGVSPTPVEVPVSSYASWVQTTYLKRMNQSVSCMWLDSDTPETAGVQLTIDADPNKDVESAGFGLDWEIGTIAYCSDALGDTACNGWTRHPNGDSVLVNFSVRGTWDPGLQPGFESLVADVNGVIQSAERRPDLRAHSVLSNVCEEVAPVSSVHSVLGESAPAGYLRAVVTPSLGAFSCEGLPTDSQGTALWIKWMPAADWAWNDAEESRTGDRVMLGETEAYTTCEGATPQCTTDFMISDTWVSVTIHSTTREDGTWSFKDSAAASRAISEIVIAEAAS